MPPRGRPKKGHKRIDAAIDALGQLGFSRDLVCKTVNDLLKVYEGDDGWPFIEEASYKLVIETILEEQEKDGKKGEGETSDGRALEDCEQGVGNGEASSHLEALADTTAAGPTDGCISWKDISCTDHESRTSLHGQCQHGVATTGEAGGPSNAISEVSPIHSHQPILPLRPRRRPCYGWISESEDDEVGAEDPLPSDVGFIKKQEKIKIEEPPPSDVGFIKKQKFEIDSGLCRERKRRSRWDERPLGM